MSNTLTRLRVATRDDHQRLEESLDIFEKVRTREGRRRLVERFYGLHAGLERAITPALAPVAGLDFAARSRLPSLELDLQALGVSPAALPLYDHVAPDSRAEALGLLYVMEGSTLGGHVIRRRLAADGVDSDGLSFLDPYGEDVGARWRSFLGVLERETGADDDREAAVSGARAGFALTHDWLCPAGTPS